MELVGSWKEAWAQDPGLAPVRRVGWGGRAPGLHGDLGPGMWVLGPELHPSVRAGAQWGEGGGPGTDHGSLVYGLEVSCEEGRLETPGAPLDNTAVGWQLVVTPRSQEDGLPSPGLVVGTLGYSGPRELELVAELGPQHGRVGPGGLQEVVLGGRSLGWGARHHGKLVWNLLLVLTRPGHPVSLPQVPVRPPGQGWAPPLMLPVSRSLSPTIG